MCASLKLKRPEILSKETEVVQFNNSTDVALSIKALEDGRFVLITGLYSNGLLLLKELKKHLSKKKSTNSFMEQRLDRVAYNKLSNLVLVEVKQYKLAVKKAPVIGWFQKLYPEVDSFILPFPQVQGLNSSWQWYQNGVALPVLRNKLKPFYGTYFPTRFDHLILFDNWLKRYEGPKKSAFDIGVGCGVLSLQMVGHGFQKVFATDTNPNAIVGMQEMMGDTKLSRKIDLDCGNLFGKFEKPSELIVFNPPWLPEVNEVEGIDAAMYYGENLFEDFFKAAKKQLTPDGKLVLLFSNLAQITEVSTTHPIELELKNGGRFKLEKCLHRKVKAASTKTKREQHWRDAEQVELWILTH